jgi:hypothetical protein
MIDVIQGVGLLAGALLIAVLAVRELRWPKRLGTGGRWTVGILVLIVIVTATMRIIGLVVSPT